jgi:hypothetical protein
MSAKLLSFAKPEKARPSDAHNRMNSSDSGVEGTYASNMSEEDKQKWKGKLVGSKSGNFRVEIRKIAEGTNILVIVNGEMPTIEKFKMRGRDPYQYKYKVHGNEPHQVKMSANGPMYFTPELWQDLQQAIREARQVLSLLDDPARVKDTLKTIRAGKHPLIG